MGTFVSFWRRIGFLFHRDRLTRELAEEIEFHRSAHQSDNGSRHYADRQMGNVTAVREECRDMWSFLSLEHFWQDVRYAIRTFLANPAFTAVAAISLALGIGGNVAVFSLVNSLLIRPLPFPEPDRLVRITEFYPLAAFSHIKQQSRSMDVASVTPGKDFNLAGFGEASRVFGSDISTNLLEVLGVRTQRGRGFLPGEDQPGRDRVMIISHALWTSRFAADPGIIGRFVSLDGVNREIVGVMPPAFQFPTAKTQIWIPSRINPAVLEESWASEFSPLLGRLRPGATMSQAAAEVRALVPQVRSMFPFPMERDWNAAATAIPLQDDMVSDIRTKLLVLLSAVGMVLLIACTNVASLLLARATSRRKEIALRAALGAGRVRILRQLLTESVLLASIGGGFGILLAAAVLQVFRSVLPASLPGVATAAIDNNVLAFTAALAILTGVAFGFAPALSATQIDLTESIKTGGKRSAGRRWASFRGYLIGAELALTVILVVAAGLLIKTLYALSNVNPGFRPDRLVTVRITPNQLACVDRSACIALYDKLLLRARALAGISDVAIANNIPLVGEYEASTIPVDVEGYPRTADHPSPMFWAGAVSPDYLRIMNMPVIAGRGFTEADSATSSGIIVVSAATAKRYWPGQNPIGKHIKPVFDRQWRTVVGVVADTRHYSLTGESPDWIRGVIYMPYPQSVQGRQQIPAAMNLIVRTSADPQLVGARLRELAQAQNPDVPVSEVQTMDRIVADSIADRRSTMSIFIAFAIGAVALAAIGVYGLVSYAVTQRTYEIGLRMAIGATRSNVVGLVMAQTLRVAFAGIATGMFGAILLSRYLSTLLYGVTANDPFTLVSGIGVMLAITAAASCVPAWRATRIDPALSLRVE